MLINYAGILVAALLAMIMGSVWYSPLLFGRVWMRLSGKGSQTMTFPVSSMLIEFVCALVTAFVLSFFTAILPASAFAAAVMALFIWVGFYLTLLLGEVVWEGKAFTLFLLNAGLRLINITIMTLVLTLWR